MAAYTVSVDEKTINFEDNLSFQSEPSAFTVMMDFLPVYYAYKYYSDEGFKSKCLPESIEQLSYVTDAYSRLYSQLQKDINFLNSPSYLDFVNSYSECLKEIVEVCYRRWRYEDDDNEIRVRKFFEKIGELREIFQIAHFSSETKIELEFCIRSFEEGWKTKNRALFWLKRKVKEVIWKYSFPGIAFVYKAENLKASYILNRNVRIAFSQILLDCCNYLVRKIAQIPTPKNMLAMADFFNETKNSVKGIGKFKKKGPGCFAIMENNSGNVYYALSGQKSEESNFDNLAKELENKVLNSSATRCTVTDNMVYFSYVQMTNHPTFVYRPTLFKDRLNKSEDVYACCERKILANPDVHVDNKFFIRWAPCERCRPALINRYDKIYAFAESSKESYNVHHMDEYEVKLDSIFLCEKK